jgi:hypothetical protein
MKYGKNLSKEEKLKLAQELMGVVRQRKQQERMRDFQPNNQIQQQVWGTLARPDLRILIVTGGNRSGKTEITTQAAAMLLYGDGPLAKRFSKRPVEIRQCSPDFDHGVDNTLIPKWKQIIRRDGLRGGAWQTAFSAGKHRLEMADQSFVEWMTYGQPAELHQAAQRVLIIFDEWPTEPILKESRMRVMDVDGLLVIAATPTAGTAEAWQLKLIKDIENGKVGGAAVFHLSTLENAAIRQDRVKKEMEDMTEDEIEMRIYGRFIPLGGRCLPEFDPTVHYIDAWDKIPEHFPKAVALDVHENNPNYGAFAFIDIDSVEPSLHVWNEFTCAGTVAKTCEYLGFASEGHKIDTFLIERSVKGFDHNTARDTWNEFQKYYPWQKWNKDAAGGRQLLRKFATVDPLTQKTRFFVHNKCEGTRDQLLAWSYKDPSTMSGGEKVEQVRKVNDHFCDCVRALGQWFAGHYRVNNPRRNRPRYRWVSVRDPITNAKIGRRKESVPV